MSQNQYTSVSDVQQTPENPHQEYLPSSQILKSLHSPKGTSRLFTPAGKTGYKQGYNYDILVIDERNGFYNLRHVVTTLYKGYEPLGFCDMTSNHLLCDYKIVCFGSRNERIYRQFALTERDYNGIPAQQLRLGAPNHGKEGYLVKKELADHPVAQAMPVLNKQVLDTYHHHELNQRRNYSKNIELFPDSFDHGFSV